ncbi:unnamed protein product, partial [Chrysoparadoxa australica]
MNPLEEVNAWFSKTFGGADWPDFDPLQDFVKLARERNRWLWSVGLCAKLYRGIINRGLKGSCPFPVAMQALQGAFGQGMDAELFCSDLVPYCMGLLDLGVAGAAIKQQLQWSRDKLLDDRDVLGLFSVLQLIGVRAVELKLKSELAMPILCLGKDACNALIGASYLTETVTPGTAVPVLGWHANGHTKLIRRWRGVPCLHPSAFLHLVTEAKQLTREQQQDVDALPLLLKQVHLAREKHDIALLACCKRCLPPEEAAAHPAIGECAPKYDDVLSRAWAEHHRIEVNALTRKQLARMWWLAGGCDPGWWDRDAALLKEMIKWVASIEELFSQLPPVQALPPEQTPRAVQRGVMKAVSKEKAAGSWESLSPWESKLIKEYLKMEAKLRAVAPLPNQFGKRLDKVPVYDREGVAIGVACMTGGGIAPKKHRLEVKKIPVLPDNILFKPAGDIDVDLGDSQHTEKRVSQSFDDSELVRGMCHDMLCDGKLVHDLPHVTNEEEGRHPLDEYKTVLRGAGNVRLGMLMGIASVERRGQWEEVKAYRLFVLKTDKKGSVLKSEGPEQQYLKITLLGDKPALGEYALPVLAAELVDWDVVPEIFRNHIRESWMLKCMQQCCYWLTSWKLHHLYAPSESLVLQLKKLKESEAVRDGGAKGHRCLALTEGGKQESVPHFEPLVATSKVKPPHRSLYWETHTNFYASLYVEDSCDKEGAAGGMDVVAEGVEESKGCEPGEVAALDLGANESGSDAPVGANESGSDAPVGANESGSDAPEEMQLGKLLTKAKLNASKAKPDVSKDYTLQAHAARDNDSLKGLLQSTGVFLRELRRHARNGVAGFQGIMCQLMNKVVYKVQGQDTRAQQVQLVRDVITGLRKGLCPEPCKEDTGDAGEHKEEADGGEQDEGEEEGEDQADGDMLEAVRAAASRPLLGADLKVDTDMMLYALCQRATSVPQHLRIAEGLASLLEPAASKDAAFKASLKTARKRGGGEKMTPLREALLQAWRVITGTDADEDVERYLYTAAQETVAKRTLSGADHAPRPTNWRQQPAEGEEGGGRRKVLVTLGGMSGNGGLRCLEWVTEDGSKSGDVPPPEEKGKQKLWEQGQCFLQSPTHLKGK